MPNASSLIARNVNSSQEPSAAQLWVISAQDGTTFNVGFDKEFVKKHLFVDPAPPVNPPVKATSIVGKINTYGNLVGGAAEVVPPNLDANTLRFLKLKKLVLSRTVQGTCSVCHEAETQHDQLCFGCDHKHKKAWANGGECKSVAAPDCKCAVWNPYRAGTAKGCPGFTVNDYDQARTAQGKPNPFGGSGGACTGTNTVVLMNEIDVQHFKDIVVGAIKAENLNGWNPGQKKEGNGLPLDFGAATVATVKSDDTLIAFNNRAKSRGIKVFIRLGNDGVYRIYHYHEEIA